MSANGHADGFDDQVERLQGLLTALDGLSDPATRSAARELVSVVISMHGTALADLMAIIRDTGSQPADTVLPKLAVNPRVRGLLLLHDLHPDDLAARARQAVQRLRPHLAVQGVRADLVGVDDGVVHIRVAASGQKNQRPPGPALKHEIEATLMEMAPDAREFVIEGLDTTSEAREAYVPFSAIARAGAAGD